MHTKKLNPLLINEKKTEQLRLFLINFLIYFYCYLIYIHTIVASGKYCISIIIIY